MHTPRAAVRRLRGRQAGPLTAPVPQSVSATAGSAQVALSWSAGQNVTYNLYRSVAAGAEALYKSGLTQPGYTDTGLTNGTTYFYQVTSMGGGGESARSAEVSATPQAPPTATASFVGMDAATRGNWKGVYGADGYSVSQDPSTNNPHLPAYAAVTLSGNNSWIWDYSTTDPRAPQKSATSTTDRLAACWYSVGATNSFDVDVNLTDGQAHRVALYCLDWDGGRGHSQSVTVRDAASGTVLSAQSVSGFNGGAYLTWTVKGHVVFRLTDVAGANAVLNALFFDLAK